jgi:arsenate reductase
MSKKVKVLFLCTGNARRSQMAEGFARHFGGDTIEAHSAGVAPEPIPPETVEVMREVGVDISGQRSKGLEAVPREVDVVVTLCDSAAEACPFFPGSPRILHWPLPDPALAQGSPDQVRQVYRQVRDRIAGLVRGLLTELLQQADP